MAWRARQRCCPSKIARVCTAESNPFPPASVHALRGCSQRPLIPSAAPNQTHSPPASVHTRYEGARKGL
eukprot:605176-Rhodomonas_salina.1